MNRVYHHFVFYKPTTDTALFPYTIKETSMSVVEVSFDQTTLSSLCVSGSDETYWVKRYAPNSPEFQKDFHFLIECDALTVIGLNDLGFTRRD